MLRLKNVPVVPPLESLRHIGLVLASVEELINNPLIEPISNFFLFNLKNFLTIILEKYMNDASTELANDLAACFMCILEHEDSASRRGACKALSILLVKFFFYFLRKYLIKILLKKLIKI